MKTVTRYVADDGVEFSSEKDCLQYEVDCQAVDQANQMFQKGESLLTCLTHLRDHTSYFLSKFLEIHEVTLAAIDKDFKFVISHWQCCDQPSYGIHSLHGTPGAVWLNIGGVGGWSGYYGNKVSLEDCVRYYGHSVKPIVQDLSSPDRFPF